MAHPFVRLKASIATVFLFTLVAFASQTHAGVFEVGASGSYKRSNIATDAFDESYSLTGSISYYFSDSSAFELSYTDGTNRRVVGEKSVDGYTTNMYYKMAGFDFVLTMGEKESTIRPYIKMGAVYIFEKKIVNQYRYNGVFTPSTAEDQPALVPSAGIGFKLRLSQGWSIKVGAEAWSSRPIGTDPFSIDYAGRAGLSWMF